MLYIFALSGLYFFHMYKLIYKKRFTRKKYFSPSTVVFKLPPKKAIPFLVLLPPLQLLLLPGSPTDSIPILLLGVNPVTFIFMHVAKQCNMLKFWFHSIIFIYITIPFQIINKAPLDPYPSLVLQWLWCSEFFLFKYFSAMPDYCCLWHSILLWSSADISDIYPLI